MPTSDYIEQLDEFLSRPNQSWLLGAGISYDAGIPLMHPLTARILELTKISSSKNLLDKLISDLPNGSHIEHILSHLGDYTTLAKRNLLGVVTINTSNFMIKELEDLHEEILTHIGEIIRWGFRSGTPDEIGSTTNPIVTVNDHSAFTKALMDVRQSGLTGRRRPIKFFTLNYDTLIEDSLALGCYSYWDGFSGGAVAFRNYRYGDAELEDGCRAKVIKLHGSIDWHMGSDGKVWRIRDRDLYPNRTGRVLIYPQSTKYIATQKDPFSAQFDIFRRSFQLNDDNVLAICGYSFGDDHINQEIELALEMPGNKTTILAFCREGVAMPAILQTWRKSFWGGRVYVISEKGLYIGKEGPFHPPVAGTEHSWWTFSGATDLLKNGVGDYL